MTNTPWFNDWRDRLDARLDRCPGCDDWRFDGKCNNGCDEENRRVA